MNLLNVSNCGFNEQHPSQLASNLWPLLVPMEFRWRTDSGPILHAYWDICVSSYMGILHKFHISYVFSGCNNKVDQSQDLFLLSIKCWIILECISNMHLVFLNRNCLGQFREILWNQTTNQTRDVHLGSTLITLVIT